MRKRFAALLCALALIGAAGVTVAPTVSAASNRYICYYKYLPSYKWTDAAGARYLESTGAFTCYPR